MEVWRGVRVEGWGGGVGGSGGVEWLVMGGCAEGLAVGSDKETGAAACDVEDIAPESDIVVWALPLEWNMAFFSLFPCLRAFCSVEVFPTLPSSFCSAS